MSKGDQLGAGHQRGGPAATVHRARPARRNDRFVRRPVPLDELPTEQRDLVPTLADQRLLVIGRSGDQDSVELAHQALIELWPRLRDWLVADRAFLAWRAALTAQRER